MQHKTITYQDNNTTCKAYLAYNEAATTPQPTVLIVHAFDGITDFIRDYASLVVDAGYTAFCVDMFGQGKTANNFDACIDLIMPFINDRAMLQRRILAGFETCKAQKQVDENNIVAMGFCFGGMTVLDLARSGADVKAVASLHGVMTAPENVELGEFKAKALILHGYDDPQIKPDQLPIIADELTTKNVDWQFVYFGHTQHAFTEPHASDIGGPNSGRIYNADSARRSWLYCQMLFDEMCL